MAFHWDHIDAPMGAPLGLLGVIVANILGGIDASGTVEALFYGGVGAFSGWAAVLVAKELLKRVKAWIANRRKNKNSK